MLHRYNFLLFCVIPHCEITVEKNVIFKSSYTDDILSVQLDLNVYANIIDALWLVAFQNMQ